MRILVLNYEYPPLGGGGGKFSADLSRQLARLGHDVRVLTGNFGKLPRLEVEDGMTIHRTWFRRRQQHTCRVGEMGLFVLSGITLALRLARRWRPDLVHAHFAVPTGVLAYLLHRLTGLPYVLSCQLGDVPGGVPAQTDHLFRWLKPFTIPIWRAAGVVTTPSRQIRDLARCAYPGVTVEVIYNGIDPGDQPPSLPAAHRPVRLVFAGRFSPQKNLPFLLDTLAQVRDLEWQLEMAGDGSEMPLIRKRLTEAGLARRVSLPGWLAPAQVADLLSRSDLLVLPSLSEGLPLVGVQALAAGLAILGSDVGGIQELVRIGENGFLCPVHDRDAFVIALRTMLGEEARLAQMKAASRRLATSFDIGAIARRFEIIFRQVVGTK